MAKGGYGYIPDAYRKIGQCLGEGNFFNFIRDDAKITNSDCEYLDGFQGGGVNYARMLVAMAGRDSDLSRFIAVDYLKGIIDKNAGLAAADTRRLFSVKEEDYLKLGCNKNSG